MKKLLLLLILIPLLFIGCSSTDPLERIYVEGVTCTEVNPVELVGNAEVWLPFEAELNHTFIAANGLPTIRSIGTEKGFSLPIWNAGANYNERLFYNMIVPDIWNGNSNPIIEVYCATGGVEANKKFQLRISWEHYYEGQVIGAGENDIDIETDTGVAGQYQLFIVQFPVDWDLDLPANPALAVGDLLSFQLKRIAATSDEVGSEIIIDHLNIKYQCDKIGASTY